MKKIYIGADHAGYEVKEFLEVVLHELHIPFEDVSPAKVLGDDYPLIAKKVCQKVVKNKSKGILVCDTGVGMSIAANKQKGIRAALVSDVFSAERSRQHNDANVLVLSAELKKSQYKPLVMAWFKAKFSGASRHVRRIKQL